MLDNTKVNLNPLFLLYL